MDRDVAAVKIICCCTIVCIVYVQCLVKQNRMELDRMTGINACMQACMVYSCCFLIFWFFGFLEFHQRVKQANKSQRSINKYSILLLYGKGGG